MNTRLNDAHRMKLYELRDKIVGCPAEHAMFRQAYEQAAPLVRVAVTKKYPEKDMKVCARYEAAHGDDCIKLTLSAGGVQEFNFDKDTGPLVVKKTYSGQMYAADDLTTTAVLEWVTARDSHKAALKQKHEDYGALIRNARTLDEVVEVWPEAEQLRTMFGKPLVALSEEVKARIRDDVRTRH
jgi:hypothetical protein